ncbi:group-specific protein [Halalkalibacillus sediminis]|uniref:Group-specific protein n=1 Tax=Halalkalibacillus sediminis TaxID=2018042 RepID=A0A2I0QQU8_9BACI|nr:group-specific protein [Halalkalibacillus sediminis]PKR76712.1 group-specific protein [Halalkalibacillus sediminis]
MVPKELKGEQLIPLNEMKTIDRRLYNQYTKKYIQHPERKKLLTQKIPKIDCLFNDVVHLSPIHPNMIYKSLKEMGIQLDDDMEFYQIPVEQLRPNVNVYYLFKKSNYLSSSIDITPFDIRLLDVGQYDELLTVPNETIHFYQNGYTKDDPQFAMFHYIPHVFSLGNINLQNVETVRWSDSVD